MREKLRNVIVGSWYVALTYWGFFLVRLGIQKAAPFPFDDNDF